MFIILIEYDHALNNILYVSRAEIQTGGMSNSQSFARHAFTLACLLPTVLAATACQRVSAKPEQAPLSAQAARNRVAVQRYFDEVWNQGKLEVLDQLLAEDYVNHSSSLPGSPPGPAGVKPIVAAMRRAFPDLHYRIDQLVTTDAAVAARVTLSGTHRGDFFGIAPTGKRFEVTQTNIERFRDGKIVEHWRNTDELSLLRQLGVK
jgi:steroid delta-isomerase-like uncharacterized protein